MQALKPEDARLIHSEAPRAHGNVSLIHIYDQSTVPGGTLRFKTVLAHIESRLGRSPVFRRKLQRAPLGLGPAYWIDDENFDLEYHVRHIALPKPGDWRQFCIQLARLHARPLDLDRPLWEIYVVEGLDAFTDLPAGSFALLTKTHHVAIDSDDCGELTGLLHDVTSDVGAPAPPEPWFPRRAPPPVALLRRGLMRAVGSPLRMAVPLARAIGQVAPAALAWVREALRPATGFPETRFNAAVSPHRVFETRRFALEEFETVRRLVPGATVDDVVLAVCAGALRRYLQRHDELPTDSLTAFAPACLSSQAGDSACQPHERGWMPLRLATEVADPVQRLRAICAQTTAAGAEQRALGARQTSDTAKRMPAATLSVASKWLGRAGHMAGRSAPLASCAIANVPGPAVPMYLCGARLSYFSAMLPISDGLGLVFAVTCYDGRLVVSPTSCRELMPDPALFALDLRESFQELWALAQPTVKTPTKIKVKTEVQPLPPPSKPRRRSASSSDKSGRAARSV